MVNSKVVLASAGAGKTYHIAENINPDSRNIVVTFTRQNVQNLKNEIWKLHNEIPSNTQVITFSSFVYRWLLKPVEPYLTVGDKTGIISEGVEIHRSPAPQRIDGDNNPRYVKQNNYKHYMYNHKYYSARMSKLVNKQKSAVKKIILNRLSQYCDAIYFDELQDFVDEDFKLLQQLMNLRTIRGFAVGDFNQHSVTKSNFNSSGKPFKNGGSFITKDQYIEHFNDFAVIDESSLIKSRRVPHEVCKFINKKLNISIESSSPNKGFYHLLTKEEDIERILTSKQVVKLIYKESNKYNIEPIINWGYSKGDTYKSTCIILTNVYKNLLEDNFSIKDMSPNQINLLYVAITRATHTVFFIKATDFRKFKEKYKL